MIKEIHQNDIGTVFLITLQDEGAGAVDLATATLLQICFKRPNGSIFNRTAVIVNAPGTDGVLKYVTIANDLDVQGVAPAKNWSFQVIITLPATGTWRSDICTFDVHPNICA